ncbi:hypothetical protein BDN72DRAFT_831397 [Pluteus cervinus]|uniref:Uncharacterized protein n=1 Tax=Pluteus cervinus TaxID=181527 RepID=A0ACD3BD84_9AGAR|nr:hypothetical protein BDN72DRAFT_831397 [Pluteus cervinus]
MGDLSSSDGRLLHDSDPTGATPFSATLVTVETSVSVDEVISRLETQTNKTGSQSLLPKVRTATTREEIENIVKTITGDRDFLYFTQYDHGSWMNIYNSNVNGPKAIVFVIGNPLIAQGIMRHDLRSALNIPPRLLILEKDDHSGSKVVYHLPSSVMALSNGSELKAATLDLDDRLRRLVAHITAVELINYI